MEMTIVPVPEGMAMHLQIRKDAVHCLTFLRYISGQVVVRYHPLLQIPLLFFLTEGWCGMGYDRIDGRYLIEGIKTFLIIYWRFVAPIDVRCELVPRIMYKASVIHSVGTFNGRCTTYTEDGMLTSFYQRIVRNGLPAFVVNVLPVEVRRVIVIAPHEHHPDIRFLQPMPASIKYVLIVARLVESKAAVTGNNHQRIGHVILHNDFIDEMVEVTVDVTRHYDVPGIGEVIYIGMVHTKERAAAELQIIPHVSSSSDLTPVRHFLLHHPALIAGASAKSGLSSVSKVVGLLSYHPALIAGASVQTRTFIRCKDTSMISHDNAENPEKCKNTRKKSVLQND